MNDMMIVNDKLETLCKEAAVVYFMLLCQHISGGRRKTTKAFCQYIRSPDRNSNTGPLEYEAGYFATAPRSLVLYLTSATMCREGGGVE